MRGRHRRPHRRTRPLPRAADEARADGQRPCIFCGARLGSTREHIVPSSRLADRHNWAKEAPCCSACNGAKGDRLPTDAEFEAFRRFWQLEVARLGAELAELRLRDAQAQCGPGARRVGTTNLTEGDVRAAAKDVIEDLKKDFSGLSRESVESLRRGLEDSRGGRTVPDPRRHRLPRHTRGGEEVAGIPKSAVPPVGLPAPSDRAVRGSTTDWSDPLRAPKMPSIRPEAILRDIEAGPVPGSRSGGPGRFRYTVSDRPDPATSRRNRKALEDLGLDDNSKESK